MFRLINCIHAAHSVTLCPIIPQNISWGIILWVSSLYSDSTKCCNMILVFAATHHLQSTK